MIGADCRSSTQGVGSDRVKRPMPPPRRHHSSSWSTVLSDQVSTCRNGTASASLVTPPADSTLSLSNKYACWLGLADHTDRSR
jgi:hypothetical protein